MAYDSFGSTASALSGYFVDSWLPPWQSSSRAGVMAWPRHTRSPAASPAMRMAGSRRSNRDREDRQVIQSRPGLTSTGSHKANVHQLLDRTGCPRVHKSICWPDRFVGVAAACRCVFQDLSVPDSKDIVATLPPDRAVRKGIRAYVRTSFDRAFRTSAGPKASPAGVIPSFDSAVTDSSDHLNSDK